MPSLFPKQSRSPVYSRAFAVIALLGLSALVQADSETEAEAIPHVGKMARANYILYQSAGTPKAFAIAPGGAWAWHADASSDAVAERQALERCQSNSRQRCVLYALNDRVVFDAEQWPTLWRPYPSTEQAARADVGTSVGSRFYDLLWRNSDDKSVSLSSLRGKIVFLHFWGSWCPPCMREFPSLKELHRASTNQFGDDFAMVLLQVREPFIESRHWAQDNDFATLPLFDSGAVDGTSNTLSLSDGKQVQDRAIAQVFPSSYVLDRNGLVIFSHYGPITDWSEYLPFIADAVQVTKPKRETLGLSEP